MDEGVTDEWSDPLAKRGRASPMEIQITGVRKGWRKNGEERVNEGTSQPVRGCGIHRWNGDRSRVGRKEEKRGNKRSRKE